MEKLRKDALAKKTVRKYSVIVLIIALSASMMTGCTASAAADIPEPSTVSPADTQQANAMVQENNALRQQIMELNNQLAARDAAIAASQTEIDTLREALAAAEDENHELTQALEALQEEYSSFVDAYGTTYFVVFEIRRTVAFPPAESILRVTCIVTGDTYRSLNVGDTLPTVSDHLSLPSGGWGVEWTATVVNMFSQPTWNGSHGPR